MYKKKIVVMVFFFLGLASFLFVNNYFSSTDVAQQMSLESDGTIATIQDSILATEYQINEVGTAVFQAPNRMNGFRASFSQEGVLLNPRVDEQAKWALELNLTQIGDAHGMLDVAEGKLSAEGNQIQVDRGNIVEWYINSSRGLEQGFTIKSHPMANSAEMLYLNMSVGGTLVGQLQDDSAIAFQTADGQVIIHYDQLFAFDADAKPLPATMNLSTDDAGAQTVQLAIETQNAQFPIVIDPMASASDWYAVTEQDDNLGFSVSSAGDVNSDGYDDVIVGANWYDNGSFTRAGAAFVYLGGEDGLSPSYAWHGVGTETDEEYGFAVSEAGDINDDGHGDIIVGTFGTDKAYIYYGDSLDIDDNSVQVLTEQAGSEFGRAVSYAGDVNRDGFADVIVGAPAYLGVQGTIRGRAFVFYGSDVGVGSTADWSVEGENDNSFFGVTVSNAGDVNGDEIDDIVIGDPFANTNFEEVGTVFVFLGVESAGLQNGPVASEFDANWSADDPSFDELSDFAHVVSNAGDVNGDGVDDIIVGAPGAFSTLGAAYVYLGPLDFGNSDFGTTVNLFGLQANNEFGYSVGTAGDLDDDGDSEVIVGAPNYDTTPARPSGPNGGGQGSGTAVIYAGDPNPVNGLAFLSFIDGDAANGRLGSSVDTAGDVNADGFSDVIVGAPTYVGASGGSGQAFVFHGTGPLAGLTAENDGPTELGYETTLTAVHTSPNSGFNTYSWDFGDGTFGGGQVATHTYQAPGVYTATVSVTSGISPTLATAVTFVTIQEELYVDPVNGGSTTFNDGNGNSTQVDVPPGAVDEPINIEYIPLNPNDGASGRGLLTPNGLEQPLPPNNTNIFFDLNAGTPDNIFLPLIANNSAGPVSSGQTQQSHNAASQPSGGSCDPDHFCFNEPVVIVLGYNEADLNGEDENSLILVVWDENINQWVDATSTCEVPSGYTYDPANNTFSLEICHISRFGMVGAN